MAAPYGRNVAREVRKIVNLRIELLLKRHHSTDYSTSEYCMEIVRKSDYENYLCSLLLPQATRMTAFAIRALNSELAQIRDIVSNQHIGLMRIQFWRETLDKIFEGNPPQQPVAMELFHILKGQKLSKHWFHRLIDSREKSLDDVPHQTIPDLEDYAEKSVSPIFYLLLQSKGINNVQSDHAASHLGKTQGILNLIRGIPYNASRGRVYLPLQTLIKHNVSQEDILRGKKEKNITEVVFEIAAAAHQHLEMVRSLKKHIHKDAASIFLPATVCDCYLERLQKEDFNVFSPKLQLRDNRLPLILWWKNFRHKY